MPTYRIAFTTLIAATLALAANPLPAESQHSVWSKQPAQKWQEALVTGNGRMGVLVFGDPSSERVVFNHERLYEPLEETPVPPPNVAHILPEVRRLTIAGEYTKAREEFAKACRAAGFDELLWTDPYHPAMAMRIEQPNTGKTMDYRRSTDFRTGEIAVCWTDNTRETFVSRTHNVVVQRFRASADLVLNLAVSLENQDQRPADEQSASYAPPEIETVDDTLVYRCKYRKSPRGYLTVTRAVATEGQATLGDGELTFKGRELLLLTRVVSVEDWSDRERLEAETRAELAALPAEYGKLFAPHAAAHGAIYDRMAIDLGGSNELRSTSSERLLAAQRGSDRVVPALLEKMFNMGRFSFLCSSGEWPPNLMGIFNGEWRPKWSGDFTLDANVNLQIAPADIAAVPEGIDSYANLIEGIADDWRTNAQSLYGCRGLLAGTRTDGRHNLHTHHALGAFPGFFWTAGAEWLVLPLYEHYQVTGDQEFARARLLPLMKGVVDFYEDFLVERDADDNFIFAPSYSPENAPANTGNPLAVNATMDIACTHEACRNLIALCRDLGGEEATITRCERLLEGLPPYLTNGDGALKEWAWPSLDDNYDHRHLSHLYPVWPGHEISPEGTPELYAAAKVAAAKRGRGNGSAHGLAHMALVGARLKDAEIVQGNLRFMLSEGYLLPSLFTYHNPGIIYNADMLHSLPAVVVEMLVYSKTGQDGRGEIELLPALGEAFPTGQITGAGCRCRATVDRLAWDLPAGQIEATITSRTDQTITLRVRSGIASVTGDGARLTQDNTVSIELKAGESRSLTIALDG